MPKITVIAACNDVLFDDIMNPSLINVFSALEAQNMTGATIDSKALAPQTWYVFTMWRADREDMGKTFTQRLRILSPDESEFGFGSEKFTMDKLIHSLKVRVQGFPIGLEGDVTVKVWLEVGSQRVTKISNLPINVKHVKRNVVVTK